MFIHASDENRAERIVSVYGQREEAPAKRLHDKDKSVKPSTSFTQAHPGAKLTTIQFVLTAEFWEPINA